MSSTREVSAGEVREVQDLSSAEREALYVLMDRHYVGVTLDSFRRDLDEKKWIVLLRDASGGIGGFSTMLELESRFAEERIRVLFSGDTIVDRSLRGSPELARTWAGFTFAWAEIEPSTRAFWFLISSGVRTYRFLPLFFARFVPNPRREEVEDWGAILKQLSRERFGNQYDEGTGIVRLRSPSPQRPDEGNLSGREAPDPDTAFFLERNPGWPLGDELACLTQIARSNLTRAGERMVRPKRASR